MMRKEKQTKYHPLRGWVVVLAAMLVVLSCRDPYNPEIEGFESLLVVEGRLTTDTAGNEVLLSRSYGFEGDTLIPISGAQVVFEKENGDREVLQERNPGEYRTDPADFMPAVGERYRLYILTAEGEEYASDYQTVLATPEIDKVEPNYVNLPNPDGTEKVGVEFRLSTSDPTGATTYYGWSYEEAWEFYTPYRQRAYWVWDSTPPIVRLFPLGSVKERCWRFDESTNILVGTSRQLEEDRIVDFPVHYVGIQSRRVYWGYSLKVEQFALSEAEYTFLNTLKKNTETTGSIFDPVPAEVVGNIRNLNDPDEPVIGFFGASELTTTRVFMDRSFFPDSITPARPLSGCEADTLFFNYVDTVDLALDELRFATTRDFYVYLDTAIDIITPLGYRITQDFCADCELTGTAVKPPYWPN